jgi:hypothetical protein
VAPVENDETKRDVERLRDVLGTLIAWMAQSATSPIRIDEAETLLKKLLKPLNDR